MTNINSGLLGMFEMAKDYIKINDSYELIGGKSEQIW